jgi:hypothetical protein
MRSGMYSCMLIVLLAFPARSQTSNFLFTPLVNEVTLFQNFLDDGGNAGQTLQIVSINSFRLFADFNFEFTGDFSRKLTPGTKTEYYIELGIVKPVWKKTAVNYQRIYGTFIDRPINQIGLRYCF